MADIHLSVDITKKFPGFTLDISFTADRQTLGLLGASGSGKSMILRCIAGLEKPDAGKIILNNQVLFDSDKNIDIPSRQRNIGFLFQNYALFPHMTVAENIAFGLDGLSKIEQKRRVAAKLAMIKMEDLGDRYPHQLSGGQQQRVALARALVREPAALLLDEPFSALDNHLRNEMERQLIKAIAEYSGISIFVTHDLDESYRVCHNLMIIHGGKEITRGLKEDIFNSPPTIEAAQITGCKNISRARLVDQNIVEAVDWGCQLWVTQPIPNNLSHIGIRAHHLSLVKGGNSNNTFPCHVVETSETPHQKTLYLKLDASVDNNNRDHKNNNYLQAKVYKEQWVPLQEQSGTWYLHFDPNLLFLMQNKDF